MPSALPYSAPTSRAGSPTLSRTPSSTDHFGNANAPLTATQVLGSIPEHLKSACSGARSLPGSLPGSQPSSQPVSRSNSISFKVRDGHDLASGRPTWGKPKNKRERIRGSSPPAPTRFKHHVSFDNFAGGEPTENNAISFTLNSKHTGYQYKKRSRTFMVGIDENEYSDTALKWMLAELVDDGDEIVCVRVVDPDAKLSSSKSLEKKQYQEEAQQIMAKIQASNDNHQAISIVLEFAVGKLHTTFGKMIKLYEPAMLIVGTKGRSLGGLQGLMGTRNSFSKWCLQYSPIPVVVVRPDEKRVRKKKKRDNDPSRHNYRLILKDSGTDVHETNAEPGGSFAKAGSLGLEPQQEAFAVAAALGLRASFDHGSMKPISMPANIALKKVGSAKTHNSQSLDGRPPSPKLISVQSPYQSEVEDSSDDDDDEFEAVDGHTLLGNGEGAVERRERLHKMEMAEAQALAGRKASVTSVGSSNENDEDDGDVSGLGRGGSMWVI